MSKMKLRQKERISYYEPEEPNLDEYVFCEKCGDFVYEYCAIHGPLLVIPDDKVSSKPKYPSFVPRAALTIPSVFLHLARSRIPGAGIGVFTTLTLPRGVRFGPYRGRRTHEMQSVYCWQIYNNNKPSHVVDAADADASNWMRYVNCSRHWQEQNLVAYQYRGQLYYRTIKIIPRFTELMVFYGPQFANFLHIDLRKYNSPPGYAQKFGLPPNKKVNLDENHNVKQIKTKSIEDDNLKNDSNFKTTPVGNEIKCQEVCGTKNKQINNKKCFICNDCGKGCDTKDLLVNHINRHKPILNKPDQALTKEQNSSNTKNTLVKPYKKIFKCQYCSYISGNYSNLKRHTLTHTGEKPYTCQFCSYSCTLKGNLKSHIRIHTSEKPYTCQFCSYSCTLKGNLKSHIRIHTGEKPYRCKYCFKTFTQNGSLKTHLRTHTGEKPYLCEICHKKFTRNRGLKKHLQVHMSK